MTSITTVRTAFAVLLLPIALAGCQSQAQDQAALAPEAARGCRGAGGVGGPGGGTGAEPDGPGEARAGSTRRRRLRP